MPDPDDAVVRAIAVDDEDLVLSGIRAVIDTMPDVELVGTAKNGFDAITLCAELAPDLIIMDVRMGPGIDGVEATRRILAVRPDVSVLMLTMYSDDAAVVRAVKAGARGYILKGSTHAEMTQSIRAVTVGAMTFSSGVARTIAQRVAAAQEQPEAASEFTLAAGLTAREVEVLRGLCSGLDDRSLAGQLFIETKTVRNHVANIVAKLGVRDRTAAVVKAKDAGLGKP